MFYYNCVFRCNPNSTMFPTVCTPNHTQIDGELILKQFNLDFGSLSIDFSVIVGLIVVLRCATYVALRLKSPYQKDVRSGA